MEDRLAERHKAEGVQSLAKLPKTLTLIDSTWQHIALDSLE